MREARAPVLLVTRARAIEHLNAHDGQAVLLEHDQLEAVVEPVHRRLAEVERRGGDAWQAREDDPRGKAQSSLHSIFPLFRERRRSWAEAARIRKHPEARVYERGLAGCAAASIGISLVCRRRLALIA